jgi:uncharacterized protein YbjQ (UPF0145 family)
VLITTTNTVEGRPIKKYVGLVTGEAIVGANFVKDWFASIRDVVGGRTTGYEETLRDARAMAFGEMIKEAAAYNANAIIGVDIDYEVLGRQNGMLMVCVSGTAVLI